MGRTPCPSVDNENNTDTHFINDANATADTTTSAVSVNNTTTTAITLNTTTPTATTFTVNYYCYFGLFDHKALVV